jgi:hypothetical protein
MLYLIILKSALFMLILYRSLKHQILFSIVLIASIFQIRLWTLFESKYTEMKASLFKIPYTNPIKI